MPKTPHPSRSLSASRSKACAGEAPGARKLDAALSSCIGPQVLWGVGTTAGAAGEGIGTPLLISVSSFCLSAPFVEGEAVGAAGVVELGAGAVVSSGGASAGAAAAFFALIQPS